MWKLLRNLLLLAILCAGVLKLVLWYEVQQSAARLVAAWAPVAQVQYDALSVNLNGTVSVGGATITIGKGRPNSIWRAAQLEIETPGPVWLLLQAIGGDDSFPAHLGVSIKGLQPPAGASPLDWPWLSPLSLVPFETFGCGIVSRFSVADYQRMGLNPGAPQQHLDYHYDANAGTLGFSAELSTPPFSTIGLHGELQHFDPRTLSASSWQKLHPAAMTAEYTDSGYLAKRNRFCAQQNGSDAAVFLDQHVNAIKAYLESVGVATTSGVEGIYRELATSGGRMSVQSLPSPGVTFQNLSSNAPDALLRQLNLTTRHNDAPPIMLRLAFKAPSEDEPANVAAAPVPAAAVAAAATTSRNPAAPLPTAAAPPPSVVKAVVPAAATAASGPAIAATAPAPAAKPVSIPASTSLPKPPAPAAATANPKSAPAPVGAVASAPDAIASLPSTAAPAAGSTLALVWKPTVDRLPESPAPERDYDVIEYAAANSHGNRMVRVLTSGGKRVEGRIVSANDATLVLRVNRPGGSAELQVQRSVILEIQLLRPRSTADHG